MTRRRLLLALIALAACLGLFGVASAADAQQPPAPRRIGVLGLGFSPESKEAQAFREGLRQSGYTEGRDVVIEWRSASGDYARIPALVADLVQSKVDVIVVQGTRAALAIKRSDDQFWTNSIIIEGTHEVMLVDAQLTKTNAEKVLEEIKATKKPLSIIYITHEHADHFLGLEVFKEAYPTARILANSNVVDRINKVYQEKIDKWKGILGSGATSHTVAISKYDDNFIEFENSKIEVLRNLQGDTDENTMLWLPGQNTLIAGDVLFNDMHLYTAETDMAARKRWLNSLRKSESCNLLLLFLDIARLGPRLTQLRP